MMNAPPIEDDWNILKRFLPTDWANKARQLGALQRKRKIDSPEILLRVLLIHLADGKSLRTTAAYAQEINLCDVNDVTLLHRLRGSEEWFRWIAYELLQDLRGPAVPEQMKRRRFRIRLVDGTSISEPGSTGTDWRIHYCLRFETLRCDTFRVTAPRVVEDFQRYPVEPDDLLIGDRAYCKRKGITHVLTHRGQVLVRFHSNNLPLFTRRATPFAVLDHLRALSDGQAGDWDVWFRDPYDEHLVKGRLCALRKSQKAIELAHKHLRRMASKKGKKLRPETLEYAEYVILFTTVNRHNFTGEEILSLYRGRWQIELVFKRLKGILGLGHLPKHHPESCVAWLYGKLIVALLVERLYQEAELFSPWGYPLRPCEA
jgi:hypothetical protein